MKHEYSILSLCENLQVSPGGYYGWLERRNTPGQRAQANAILAKDIRTTHQKSRQTYGSPRIVMELRQQGKRHGRYRVQTTDSNHDEPIAPNRLAKASKPTAPNQIWVQDITYIETKNFGRRRVVSYSPGRISR